MLLEKKEDPLYTEIELFKGSDSDRGKPLTLMWRFGKRNIENNSVIITKDGCYLLCLRGSLESEGDKAAVEVHSKSNGGPAVLIFEGQMTNREMNLLTLQRLLKGDTMYVTVTGDSTVKLLNLSLKLTFLSEIPFDEGDPTPQ
ncbi:hypothetical protein NDU88_004113 [Pleurodeles waltl]|uniref:Uncharacterized protein n=1 Tax=Pleurodeles waltl TaxID=8319 RepID=A0AAV7T7M6_PLEWA|nr:hypothetical protein NDU88_004113 [Pleurodeles waltl]